MSLHCKLMYLVIWLNIDFIDRIQWAFEINGKSFQLTMQFCNWNPRKKSQVLSCSVLLAQRTSQFNKTLCLFNKLTLLR